MDIVTYYQWKYTQQKVKLDRQSFFEAAIRGEELFQWAIEQYNAHRQLQEDLDILRGQCRAVFCYLDLGDNHG